jgi:hypothetical protein
MPRDCTDVATNTANNASAMYDARNSPKTPRCISPMIESTPLPDWRW